MSSKDLIESLRYAAGWSAYDQMQSPDDSSNVFFCCIVLALLITAFGGLVVLLAFAVRSW